MSRHICNLINDKIYKGNDIGRAIERYCIKNHINCPNLTHGKINDELRRCGIEPIKNNGMEGNGYRESYRGADVIPFVEDYIKNLKASKKSFTKQISIDSLCKQPKKRKAKPESNQTPQTLTNDAELSSQHQTSEMILALIKASEKLVEELKKGLADIEDTRKALNQIYQSIQEERK